MPAYVSEILQPNAIYTREDLKSLLSTNDATINTGVFHPKGLNSVLLFVTKEKTKDRTQYIDRLEGDQLHWQGQTKSRTDPLIIEHRAKNLELLVFYRLRKYEFEGAGFRYLGIFNYKSHTGNEPANFVLEREVNALDKAAEEAATSGVFDLLNVEDARRKTLSAIVRRQGQPAFRRKLIQAYSGKCAATSCDIKEILEAAHIHPYKGPLTNHISNGLLLRADIHTLFDLGMLAVNEQDYSILIAPGILNTSYGVLKGQPLNLPSDPSSHPNKEALREHRERAGLSLF